MLRSRDSCAMHKCKQCIVLSVIRVTDCVSLCCLFSVGEMGLVAKMPILKRQFVQCELQSL